MSNLCTCTPHPHAPARPVNTLTEVHTISPGCRHHGELVAHAIAVAGSNGDGRNAMTTPDATTRSGWAAPTEDPFIHHHFTGDETRSRCGKRFWTGPRGETSPRAVKCEDCQRP